MYRPLQVQNPQTLERERQEHEARNEAKFVHKDIGMLLGNLIAFRSCRVSLSASVYENPIKSDVSEIAHDLGIQTLYLAAHGSIQRQQTRKPYIHKPPLAIVKEFSEEHRDSGLIVIHGTDYTNKSTDGDEDSLDYFARMIHEPGSPMVCTLGYGVFDPEDARPSRANDLLTSLRGYAHFGQNGITEA